MFLFHLICETLVGPPVWAMSSSEGMQDSAELCALRINDSGRKEFQVTCF
jgi:hypothetical protein